jgi:tRNA U34 5-methylaminomethyl-2-thiouridine-forming methyltransferase MnmC
MKKRVFTTTKDGSQTLYIPELNEHYHSTNGAIQEAEIVYLNAALNYCKKDKVKVLEIGFGTGLNAYLTMLSSEKDISYTSMELYPLVHNEYSVLNYHELIKGGSEKLFLKLHETKWGEYSTIRDKFRLRKINEDISLHAFDNGYDVVYFDAFAPDIQPHLWTEKIFKKIYDSMNSEGVLTTYCVKGIVKRALKACGFKIEKLPGALGKREMLRAIKE